MNVAKEVHELIHKVPDTTPYETLKDALIMRTGISEQRELDTLFSQIELGDKKPSQLLRHMRQLLGSRTMDDTIFGQLWIENIPTNVRQILAGLNSSVSLEELV